MTQTLTAPGTGRSTSPAFQAQLAASLTNQILHLIVLPTEQCNFRCTYCYEDFAVGRMGEPTVAALKRLIDRRAAGLRRLHLSWFGGEPMLARGIVEEVSAHATELAADRDGFEFHADMTTNGYLLDAEAARDLAALGVGQYQISLDGPAAAHDTTRLRADGRGSFDRIWRNLLAIRDGGLPVGVLLRVHLTPANLPLMPEFIAHLRDTFLRDERFTLHLKPVERMGGPNDGAMEILSSEARRHTLDELEAIAYEGVPAPRADGLEVCYAARPNSLVIRADGTVAKCTVALSDPSNTVGRLLPDGTLRIDDGSLAPWVRGWAAGDEDAVHCPYRGMPRRRTPALLQIGATRPA
ncbi:radical SAM protein [Kitasatospora sp. NPDC101155]|uniref:radical SAM protein n=1 Tax=Kitasatospora sp. NPDC101155 TaxID=3364097 RepID=UPI0037FCCECC